MRGHRSVRGRLSFIATAIVGAVVCLGVLGLYQVIKHLVYDDLRERGTAAAVEIAALARDKAPSGQLPVGVPGFYLLQLTDDSGRVLAASSALRGRPAMINGLPAATGQSVTRTAIVPGLVGKVYVFAMRERTPAGPRVALAATPLADLNQAKRSFILLFAITVPLLLLLVWCIVWRSVGRALRPVETMTGELTQVTGGRLDRRVTVPDTGDEVAELASEVNVTLERLQCFVEGQRTFVADASHELRSPLTALRAELEVALAHPEDEDWPKVALAALGAADRLQRIVGDLLILAKLDAGVRAERELLDLGELVRAEATHRPRRIPIHIQADPGVMVSGVPSQLERVLRNLLDNGERHARSEVHVQVSARSGEAVLEVLDDGSGIADEDRERVFQRFQRLAESRSRDAGGSGLGLAIARDIATAHHGSLVAADSDQGARMVLRLPLVREKYRSAP